MDKLMKLTGVASGVAVATGLGATAAGFGTTGIGFGTIAAGIQAGIGNVVAGSVFAVATSLGMSGVFIAAASTGGVGLLGVGVYYGYKYFFG